MNVNQISGLVVDSAMKVHSALGPGLLEKTYEVCLMHELRKRGLNVASQVGVPVVYDDVRMGIGYRIDILVEDAVIIEVKAVEAIVPVHLAQLLAYLRLSGKQLGLLINFNVLHLKDGLRRMVNRL